MQSALGEYKIFDKTFIGIYNTVHVQYMKEKQIKQADKGNNLTQNRSYFITRDNKRK